MNKLVSLAAPRHAVRRTASVLLVSLLSATLMACASKVSLDEVPVTDRSNAPTAPVSPLGQGAVNPQVQGGAAPSNEVSPVQVTQSGDVQPAQLERVVYFDYDSFVVKPEFTAMLEANARFLKADPQRRVALEGHTDERGGREYNLALGQKRAEAVRRALSLLGVSEQQAEPVSFGEEKPAVNGFTESDYAQNRRVEFTYR